MHYNYLDILDLTNKQPVWYDQNGCPRFAKFTPDLTPNIYTNTVVLARIACQDCGKQFVVQMHADYWDSRCQLPPTRWHYGDPPIHGCVGDTMNCYDLELLEVWHRDGVKPWQRHPELEGVIDLSGGPLGA